MTTYTPFNLPEKEIDSVGNIKYLKYNERMLLSRVIKGEPYLMKHPDG